MLLGAGGGINRAGKARVGSHKGCSLPPSLPHSYTPADFFCLPFIFMPMPFILDVHFDVLDLYDVATSRLLPNNLQRVNSLALVLRFHNYDLGAILQFMTCYTTSGYIEHTPQFPYQVPAHLRGGWFQIITPLAAIVHWQALLLHHFFNSLHSFGTCVHTNIFLDEMLNTI